MNKVFLSGFLFLIINAYSENILSDTTIYYCLANPCVIRTGPSASRPDCHDYTILQNTLDTIFKSKNIGWKVIDPAISRIISLNVGDNFKNRKTYLDSLSYAAWDYLSSQKINKVVIFYGYGSNTSIEKDIIGIAKNVGTIANAFTPPGSKLPLGNNLGPTEYNQIKMHILCSIFHIPENKNEFNVFINSSSGDENKALKKLIKSTVIKIEKNY